MSAERGASSLMVATAVQRDVPTRLPRSYACSVQFIRKLSSDARTTLVAWIDTGRRQTSATVLEAPAYSARKTVVQGKKVAGRGDSGGYRSSTKTKNKIKTNKN